MLSGQERGARMESGRQPHQSACAHVPARDNVYVPSRDNSARPVQPPYLFGRALVYTPAALRAASTRASLNGTRRRRTPVASYIALATAAIVGLQIVSPAP